MIGTHDTDSVKGSLFYLEYDRGLIVKNLTACGKLVGRAKDGIHNFLGRAGGIFVDYLFHTAAAKLFVFGIAGVDDAITEKDEYIAGLGVDGDFVVGNILKHAERQSGGFDHMGVAVATENGAGKAGVGHPHGLFL